MNDEELEDLMYRAGLTAQGCWDSMDQYAREAIMDFAKRVAAAEREAVGNIILDYAGRDDLSDSDESLLKHLFELIRARGET